MIKKLKNILLTILILLCTFSLNAQKNRYGMGLIHEEGMYKLKDEKRVCQILDCDHLPDDVCAPYNEYKPELIQDADYSNCTTTEYIFREYSSQDYALNMEVDIPKVKLKKGKLYPFIIWVHGGAWATGSTEAFKNQSQYLASRGIAGVRITYSLKKHGGHFERGMQELGAALRFVKKHADEWRLDTMQFGFAGGSAGTPLSSLAAMQNSGKGCKLYIGCNGIYDFVFNLEGSFCGSPIKNEYLQKIDDFKSISAVDFIPKEKEIVPAVILFHGTGDITISHKQSVALHEAILARKGISELHLYEYYAHAFFNQNASDAYEDVTLKMYDFAKRIFKVKLPQEKNR
jgi:acetyl esterase/lipase